MHELAPLAQASEWLDSLQPYGVAGICLAFFMVRDFLQSQRDALREGKREERDAKREEKMGEVVQAVNHLTRALSLEVLTRPQVVQRAREEAKTLLDEVTGK